MGSSSSKKKNHKKKEQELIDNNNHKLEGQKNSNFDNSSKEFISSKKNDKNSTGVETVENKKKVKKDKIEEKTLKLNNENDDKKIKKIEKFFKNSKLKVYLSNLIDLENGKICSLSKNKIKIYENLYFNKLYEIESCNEIRRIIQLDNNDIIVLKNEEEKNILCIYRLKDRNYFLFQTIKEERKGYRIQFIYSGNYANPKEYKVEMIKGISGNRFIIASNYGFKIYSINENHHYSLILIETHLGGIKYIYEIDDNNLIFCTENHVPAYMDKEGYNLFLIEKIKFINIEKVQTDEKSKQINLWFKKGVKYNEIDNSESLKFSYNAKVLYEYTYYYNKNIISDYIILKKKYLITIVDTDIFIFDLIKEIRYKVLKDGINNLYIDRYIKKWNDNEFIVIQKKIVSLFELNENTKKEIELKFIAYSNFSNSIKNLINIGKEKRFYRKEKDYILLY